MLPIWEMDRGGSGASGIKSVNFYVIDTSNGYSQSAAIPGTYNSSTNYWQTPLTSVNPALITGHLYYVIVQATDNNNNSAYAASPSGKFDYDKNTCVKPFLQTTTGDDHINGSLNAPGGPP